MTLDSRETALGCDNAPAEEAAHLVLWAGLTYNTVTPAFTQTGGLKFVHNWPSVDPEISSIKFEDYNCSNNDCIQSLLLLFVCLFVFGSQIFLTFTLKKLLDTKK